MDCNLGGLTIKHVYRLLVLGAGFSRPAGLPLGNELYDELVAEAKRGDFYRNIIQPELERYIAFLERTEGTVATLDDVDLERFMSFLDVEHALSFEGSDSWSDEGSRTQVLVRHLIARILYFRQRRMSSASCQLYDYFASHLEPGDKIITFNYDTIVEDALTRVRKSFRRFPARYSSLDEWGATYADGPDREIVVLKLHGSIDWFSKDHFIRNQRYRRRAGLTDHPRDAIFNNPDVRPRELIEGPYWRGSPLKRVFLAEGLDAYFREASPLLDQPPLLVSPSYSKIVYLTPLASFWSGAASAGSTNGTLAIIGYSLPAHDDYVRQALYAAVRNFQHYDTGDIIPKTNIRLVDLRRTADEQDAYRATYRFVDWTRADVCFEGFGERGVATVFAP